jgi:hypothetical protein
LILPRWRLGKLVLVNVVLVNVVLVKATTVVAPGRMIDNFLLIPYAESLPLYCTV